MDEDFFDDGVPATNSNTQNNDGQAQHDDDEFDFSNNQNAQTAH